MKDIPRFLIIAALAVLIVTTLLFLQNRSRGRLQRSYLLLRNTRPLEIRDDVRQGIILKPGKTLVVPITVARDARIAFAFGIPDRQRDVSEMYTFTVRINDGTKTGALLYQKDLLPSQKKEDRQWQEVQIDLSKL